jgi:hypothetical protein
MQIYVQDLFDIKFVVKLTCYDMVSIYDNTISSLIISGSATSTFCMHEMHNTTTDTFIVGSLTHGGTNSWRVKVLH